MVKILRSIMRLVRIFVWVVSILMVTQCSNNIYSNDEYRLFDNSSDPLQQGTALSSASTKTAFAFSDEKIVFVSKRDGNAEIYVMRGDGSQQTRLTFNPAQDVSPSWSPDGERIIFLSDRDGNSQMYIFDFNTGTESLLMNSENSVSSPIWSPDGRWIAYSQTGEDIDIYLISPETLEVFQLINQSGYNIPVSWSPDAENLLFISNRDTPGQAVSTNDLYSINIKTNEVTNITNYTAIYSDASWSPDGQKIIYVGGRDSILLLRDLFTNEEKILIANQIDFNVISKPHELFPDWLPDSQRIVFTWNKDGNDEIYVVDTLTGKLSRLTENSATDIDPDWWSP